MYFECAYCSIQFKKKYNLARHIKVTHFTGIEKNNPQLEITSHNFASLQEFNDWKEREEICSSTKFVQHRGIKFNKTKTVATRKYYCHRSGVFHSKSMGKRALKITGTYKIGMCYYNEGYK